MMEETAAAALQEIAATTPAADRMAAITRDQVRAVDRVHQGLAMGDLDPMVDLAPMITPAAAATITIMASRQSSLIEHSFVDRTRMGKRTS
jgi:hypothetical protein